MKKVLSTAVLCALLTLSIFFAGCKNSVSSGGNFNPQNTPLTLEAIADGEIIFNNLDRITGLKYKINDNDSVEITETSGSKYITVSAGDVVSLYAQGTSNGGNEDSCFNIYCSSDCYVYGNVTSLLTDAYNSTTKIEQNYAFGFLFFNNNHLTNHKSKKLILPATELSTFCYGFMFYKCTNLVEAPILPATNLSDLCYTCMFFGCTSLTKAPVLPASTLKMMCYSSMFDGCSSLNQIECLATDISAQGCTDGWLSGIASNGTFIKAVGTDWSSKTGASGIPSGWTVQEK